MPLNVLQLSHFPRRPRIPQVVKVGFWALMAWGLVALLAYSVSLA